MKKLMISAFATACAVSLSAYAGTTVDWFNGGVADGWPNATTLSGGAWTTSSPETIAPADLVVGSWTESTGLELDAGDDQLKFAAENAKTLGTGTDSVTVTSELKLYPFSEVPETVESGAKAGVILVKDGDDTFVYGVQKDADADPAANEWVKLSETAVDPEAFATITITAAPSATAGELAVTYTVAGLSADAITYDATVLADSSVQYATYAGSGFIKSLSSTAVSATKDVAVDATELAKSYLQVLSVTGNGVTYDETTGKWAVPYGESITVTFGPIDGYVAIANNTHEYAYGDIPATITVKPDDVDTPEKGKAHIDGGAWYLTLNAALDAAEDGATVIMDEAQEGPGYSFSNSPVRFPTGVTIDYGGFTYTFTEGKAVGDPRAFYILNGNHVTFQNGTWIGSDSFVTRAESPMSAFAYIYCPSVTLNNIKMDASNWTVGGSALTVLNGTTTVSGSTSITMPTSKDVTGFRSIRIGDYANATDYDGGAVVLNTTGTLEGDMWFFGGSVTKTAAVIPAATKYVWGRVSGSAFDLANYADFDFKAMSGTMPATAPENGVWSTGGELFATIQGAVDAAADVVEYDNDKIALVADTTESVCYTGTTDFTIDLNGKVWSYNGGEAGNWAALKVNNTANSSDTTTTITIKDGATGGKIYSTGDGFCVWAKTGKVLIESGKFYNNSKNDYGIYVNNVGFVEITGGEFVNENTEGYVYNPALSSLNLNAAQTQSPLTGNISVKGGTFTAAPVDDSGWDFVADGYAAKKVADRNWTVTTSAVKIGDVAYQTIQDAVDAAQDNDVVTLTADTTESVCYTGTATFTIDLNGKVWSYNGGEAGNWAALKVNNTANSSDTTTTITIKDGATGGKIYSTGDGFCVWAKTGKVLIQSGKFYNNSNKDYGIYVNNVGFVEITGGEFVNENTEGYVYNPAVSRLNLNAAQTQSPLTGNISVKGGTFTAYPKDDSHTGDQSFVADGYEATKDESTGIWTVAEAAPKGTTFMVAATGCSVTVTIAGEPATAPYVAEVGETIIFTLAPLTTMDVPAYSGTFGNESLNNTSFTDGAYSYEVTAESATEIDCQFTMIDAKNSSDVQPINVVPADTDPENVASAASNIETLATKSGESKADVTLTQNISAWVSSKSISGDSIAAVGTSAEGALTTEQFEEAYLLDCDELTTTAIENAKKEFVFEQITPGTVPTVKSNTFNGTITYEGSTDLQNWSTATTGHTFYRAVLSK